ncbi:MAG: hypothetical protein JXR44_04635 [Thiotrichales bacterium]|nr:hypothetical protein [Thiotrichales bacterium]
MASPNDVIDPNDLDSIDALLDEAEKGAGLDLQSFSNDFESAPRKPAVEASSSPSVPGVQKGTQPNPGSVETEIEASRFDENARLADLESLDVDPLERTMALSESMPLDNKPPSKQALAAAKIDDPFDQITQISQNTNAQASEDLAVEQENSDDAFTALLNERTLKNQSARKAASGAEMDAIKKVIILFGTVLIGLMLIAIGVGIWAALSSQPAANNEESLSSLQSLQAASEQSLALGNGLQTQLQAVEKKLDALNFQLEQLSTDLAERSKASVVSPVASAPIALTSSKTESAKAVSMTPVASSNTDQNSQWLKKIDGLGYRLTKTQTTVDQMRQQLVQLTAQQLQLLQSVKEVEKQQLLAEKRRLDAQQQAQSQADATKRQKEQSQYRYQTPDNRFENQGITDSYP